MESFEKATHLLTVTLKAEGFPKVMYPAIGDEMSNGFITEENQKLYVAPYSRDMYECVFLDLTFGSVRINGISVDKDDVLKVYLTKPIEDINDGQVEEFINQLSSFYVYDTINKEIYNGTLIEVIDQELHMM